MPFFVAAVLLLALALLLLLVTAERWLVALLTRLDHLLVRLGVGTWAAGAITWLEARAAERRARRAQGRSPQE